MPDDAHRPATGYPTENYRGYTVWAKRVGTRGEWRGSARLQNDGLFRISGLCPVIETDRFGGLGAKMRAIAAVKDKVDAALKEVGNA